MSKFKDVKVNFSTGGISPRSQSRIDLEEYRNALKEIENFTILPSGGARKRNGTITLATFPALFVEPGFVPFIFNRKTGFIITISFKDGTGLDFKIFNEDGTEATIDVNTYNAIVDVKPAAGLDPSGFIFTQIADVIFITHSSGLVNPIIITRRTGNNFAIEAYVVSGIVLNSPISTVLKVPYLDPNITPTTITPSALTGAGVTLTASTSIFTVKHIGAIFKLTQLATGALRINAFTSGTVVTGTVVNDFTDLTATDNWQEQAWSDERGWPRTVCAFEQKLVWGGNAGEPDTLWGSLTGNVFHMMRRKFSQDQGAAIDKDDADPPATDVSLIKYFGDDKLTDPYSFTLSSQEVNKIAWMVPTSVLNIGTLGHEIVGSGGDIILSQDSVGFKPQTSYGSKPSKAALVSNEVFFITRDGRKVRNFKFNESNGSNISTNLSILSDEFNRLGGDAFGFKDIAHHRSRGMVWLLNENQALIGLTYDRDTNTVAWSKHTITGALKIQGISVIPNAAGDSESLYLSVERFINGATVVTLEKLIDDFDADSIDNNSTIEQDFPVFTDGAVKVTLVGVTDTLTGLAHLEAEEVIVTKNGLRFGTTFTVVGGEVDLGSDQAIGDKFVTGLKFKAFLETLDVEAGGDFGPAKGSITKIDRVIVEVYKSLDCKVGDPVVNKLTPLKFEGTDIESGDFRVEFSGDTSRKARVRIESDEPLPLTVLALTIRGVTGD